MARKEEIENKELIEAGQAKRAGQLLSNYLRALGAKKDVKITDEKTGAPTLISKAEKLARDLWVFALDDNLPLKQRLPVIRLMYDRCEGKIATTVGVQNKQSSQSIPAKPSKSGVEKLNNIFKFKAS